MPDDRKPQSLDRRTFLKTSAGAAAIATPAGLVLTRAGRPAGPEASAGTRIADPATPPPSEPVMAYVHDAERGEVTVISGTGQTTYRDPALTRRLLTAATPNTEGGAADVIAP